MCYLELDLGSLPACAGEARTEAMVKASAMAFCEGEAAFDSFADPAGLIMQTIIQDHCDEAPNFKALLARAKALHLPNNPLVSLPAWLAHSHLISQLHHVLRITEVSPSCKDHQYHVAQIKRHGLPGSDKLPPAKMRAVQGMHFE